MSKHQKRNLKAIEQYLHNALQHGVQAGRAIDIFTIQHSNETTSHHTLEVFNLPTEPLPMFSVNGSQALTTAEAKQVIMELL